ncbi:hypothetical protein AK812_SmicGene23848 [Symbiodinium microadriaticum]|uniref:Uncharacterized protein n=1 Tax=Symbiodinium microadriaticum TaxID=2951 RepID=A0A1Q9DG80_SYMMI|nr:hypothetical protein AK812_SmicGene23848 [Symbiodinium microadriaticum]
MNAVPHGDHPVLQTVTFKRVPGQYTPPGAADPRLLILPAHEGLVPSVVSPASCIPGGGGGGGGGGPGNAVLLVLLAVLDGVVPRS